MASLAQNETAPESVSPRTSALARTGRVVVASAALLFTRGSDSSRSELDQFTPDDVATFVGPPTPTSAPDFGALTLPKVPASAPQVEVSASAPESRNNQPIPAQSVVPPEEAQVNHGNGNNGLKFATWALAIVGIVASIRGAIKGIFESKHKVSSTTDFVRDHSNAPLFNLHVVTYDHIGPKLHIFTVDDQSNVFKNPAAEEYFQGAANLCTVDQPLIGLNFDKAKFKPFERFVAFCLMLRIPTADAFLHRFNQVIRDRYSSIHRRGHFMAADRKAIVGDYHVLIPVCDMVEGSKQIIFRAVVRQDFERWGEPDFVAALKKRTPLLTAQIRQIELAYHAQKAYQAAHPEVEPSEGLFYWAFVNADPSKIGPEIKDPSRSATTTQSDAARSAGSSSSVPSEAR